MDLLLKIFVVTILVKLATCSIAGLTYRQHFGLNSSKRRFLRGEDPCNPLYWYPRHIPADCNVPPPAPAPLPQALPVPLPAPAPMPMPIAMPMPMFEPMPMSPMMAYPPPLPVGPSMYPAPLMNPSPPIYPPNPVMPAPLMQAGLVPGIEGLVAPGGGINILPFSDAYADLLENHKQKIIRIRLQKLLDKYDNYPKRHIRRRNRFHKYGYSSEK